MLAIMALPTIIGDGRCDEKLPCAMRPSQSNAGERRNGRPIYKVVIPYSIRASPPEVVLGIGRVRWARTMAVLMVTNAIVIPTILELWHACAIPATLLPRLRTGQKLPYRQTRTTSIVPGCRAVLHQFIDIKASRWKQFHERK